MNKFITVTNFQDGKKMWINVFSISHIVLTPDQFEEGSYKGSTSIWQLNDSFWTVMETPEQIVEQINQVRVKPAYVGQVRVHDRS